MIATTANGVAQTLGPPDLDVYREELAEAAEYLIGEGLPLTVCSGKNPGGAMGGGWNTQRLDSDRAAELINRSHLPAIGAKLGPGGGVIDFDIDGPDELEAFVDLCDGDPPVLPAYTSGRDGGEHRFAAFDERLQAIGKATVTYKSKAGNKVTVRIGCGHKKDKQTKETLLGSDGSPVPLGTQSVVPPSYHVTDKDGPLRWSGKRYQWKPGLSLNEVGRTKLPDAVIEKLIAAGAPAKSKPVDIELAGTAPPASSVVAAMVRSTRNMQDGGDGSKRLFVCCCRLIEHNLQGAAAVAAVRSYEAQRPFPRDYTDDEILKRLEDVTARGDVEVGSALVKKRELTDLGNGERFVASYGDRVRYVGNWDQWIVWTGTRWTQNETGEVERLAKRTAKNIYAEAALAEDDEEAKDIVRHAKSSQSRSRLDSMLKVAQSELPIPIMHESLDSDPWLLNCENGIVDLKSGELIKHDSGYLMTKTTGLEYPDGPGIESPLWADFLDEIFAGDYQLSGFVQRLLGMALVGQQLEHVLAIFYGSGANGKSVLVNTVQQAMGDYGMVAAPGFLMTTRSDRHPTENADLFGKRLVILSETKDGQRLDEGLVKSTTGGDRIRARRMREDFWEFTPSHTPVVVTNHKPMVQGDDFGIWRRLRLVPFTVTIPPERQDRHLSEKLRQELPFILRWLVEGCIAWRQDGLQEPTSVMAATNEYRSDCDNLLQWLEEETIATPNAMTQASVLLKRYRDWCHINGEEPLSHRKFGGRLSEKFEKKPMNRGNFYLGIGVATDP